MNYLKEWKGSPIILRNLHGLKNIIKTYNFISGLTKKYRNTLNYVKNELFNFKYMLNNCYTLRHSPVFRNPKSNVAV